MTDAYEARDLSLVSPDTLPDFDRLVELHFFDGAVRFAQRRKGTRLPDQWHWSSTETMYPADHPLITGWMYVADNAKERTDGKK